MKNKIRSKFEELFGIDLRSLALFRICMAILIILDLIIYSQEIETFYSDYGVIPRSLSLSKLTKTWLFSLHFLSGTVQIQAALFVIAGLFAIALLVGYRTKLATFMSLVLMTSLHVRNEIILDGGDQWLRLMLFWSMFLPLGACYSIDSALNSSVEKVPKQIFSAGTIALFGQLILVYWTTGTLKLHSDSWSSGNAVYYMFNLIQYSTQIREDLLRLLSPEHFKIITYFVLWLWILGPILFFSPILTLPFRTIAIVAFSILHLSFYFTLDLGTFPFKSIIAMIPLIPTQPWDKLFLWLKSSEESNLKIYYDGECGFCKKTVLIIRTFFLIPEIQILPAQIDPLINKIMQENNSWVVIDSKKEHHIKFEAFKIICSVSPLLRPLLPLLNLSSISTLGKILYDKVATNRMHGGKITAFFDYRPVSINLSKLGSILAASFLIYVTLFNLETITHLDKINLKYKVTLPENLKKIGDALYINQWWHMFVNYGKSDRERTIWFTIPATLKDGTKVDLFRRGQEVSWEKPKELIKIYKNRFWAKYMLTIRGGYTLHLPYLSAYQCRKWNSVHKDEKQIEKIDYYENQQLIFPNHHFGEVTTVLIGQYNCPVK